MQNQTNFSGNKTTARFFHWVVLSLFGVFLLAPAAWGAGLWLYEGGTPDLDTAAAGRPTTGLGLTSTCRLRLR